MQKSRLEAFSDGVIAIIITIMVLEIKVPHESSFSALLGLLPVFVSYALSFVFVGIYWNNHHHLLHSVQKINGKIMWANLHWLFWMSLIPFASGWMGENHFEQSTVTFYGVILLAAAFSYLLLVRSLVEHSGKNSLISEAVGNRMKEKISLGLYITGLGISFVQPWIAFGMYTLVALIWLYPDSRIEKKIEASH